MSSLLEFIAKLRGGEYRPLDLDPQIRSALLDALAEQGFDGGFRDLEQLQFDPPEPAIEWVTVAKALEVELSLRERCKYVLD